MTTFRLTWDGPASQHDGRRSFTLAWDNPLAPGHDGTQPRQRAQCFRAVPGAFLRDLSERGHTILLPEEPRPGCPACEAIHKGNASSLPHWCGGTGRTEGEAP